MDCELNVDIDLYTSKEKIDINLKNIVDNYLYELELVKKVKTSPTSYLFVFEYSEDIKEVVEVDIFSVFMFFGTHDTPTIPGTWNGSLLEEQGFQVKRKYTPIYIDVNKRRIHFLIRIYHQTEEFPDGGRFTRYLDKFVLTETVNIASVASKLKLIKNNLVKVLATKIEFETLNLAAGGTGITPFIRLLNYYQDLDFDINLIYCNRSVEEIMLKELFDRLSEINKRFKVTYLVSGELEGECDGVIKSNITEEIIKSKFTNSNTALSLICGPPGFNDFLFDTLHKLNFKHVHRV